MCTLWATVATTTAYPSVTNPAAGALLATEVSRCSAEMLGSTGTLPKSGRVQEGSQFYQIQISIWEILREPRKIKGRQLYTRAEKNRATSSPSAPFIWTHNKQVEWLLFSVLHSIRNGIQCFSLCTIVPMYFTCCSTLSRKFWQDITRQTIHGIAQTSLLASLLPAHFACRIISILIIFSLKNWL